MSKHTILAEIVFPFLWLFYDWNKLQTKVGHNYLQQGCLFLLQTLSIRILEGIYLNIQLKLGIIVL